MESLKNYTKNGFYYQLVERQGDWAIFRQSTVKDSTSPMDIGIAWEVFKIKVSKECEAMMGGVLVKFEAKECPPSNESFGNGAWSCHTLERAREKLAEAIKNEALNKEKREARSSNNDNSN